MLRRSSQNHYARNATVSNVHIPVPAYIAEIKGQAMVLHVHW